MAVPTKLWFGLVMVLVSRLELPVLKIKSSVVFTGQSELIVAAQIG